MNVFELRQNLLSSYAAYIRSFIKIRAPEIQAKVEAELDSGLLWPETLIQLNPSFEPGRTIDELADEGVLHVGCRKVFRIKPDIRSEGRPLRLHRHQEEAVRVARRGDNYVLTTGTGSGKSLAYMVPIVDHVLRRGAGRGVQAIVVYPMNALANSQHGELEKFLRHGFPDGRGPVRFACYTGQESDEQKQAIVANPPDILLTNYVMLELILTRPQERNLIRAAQGLRFLVLDELHTYRGRQGSDVAMLVRRVRDALRADDLQCVGTSATLAASGTQGEQRAQVAEVASDMFGATVRPENVIGETLRRATAAYDPEDPAFRDCLAARVGDPGVVSPAGYSEFIADPLSSWIEATFGLRTEQASGRLVRARPRSITGPDGAAAELAGITGIPEERCAEAIREGLLGGYRCERNPETGFPAFVFRLHQFISGGDTAYATPEREGERHVTVQGQQYVPGDRGRVLLPLVFCRECGQEYYSVRSVLDSAEESRVYLPRALTDLQHEDGGEAGFLYVSTSEPWPDDPASVLDRVPDDWVEGIGEHAESGPRGARNSRCRSRSARTRGRRTTVSAAISCRRRSGSVSIAGSRTAFATTPTSASWPHSAPRAEARPPRSSA